MEVDDYLEAVLFGPSDGFVKIGQLALNVWLARRYIPCPVPYWDSDVVETIDAEKFRSAKEAPRKNSPCV